MLQPSVSHVLRDAGNVRGAAATLGRDIDGPFMIA
jgi:hypothetical protein